MSARREALEERWPRLGAVVAVLGALAIAYATLRPAPELTDRVALLPLTCLVCGDLGGTDVALNLLLFAPFAAGLVLLGVAPARVALTALMTSLTIETLQFAFLPGRDASLSDLLTNTSGAVIVAWLTVRRGAIVLPAPRTARRLALGGLGGWLLLEFVAGWSLVPELPATAYWGQWAPDLGFLARYEGTVLGATVAGDSLPPRRRPGSDVLRRQLLSDGGPVRVRTVTGPAPRELAPIVSVFDEAHTEIFLVGQRGRTAFFRLRTRVSDLRLRPPAVEIDDVLPEAGGDSVAVDASYASGRYALAVESGGRRVERVREATPNWAWSYFMPLANYGLGDDARGLTILWVFGLLLPLGYWAGRAKDRWTTAALVAGITLGLAGVPPLFGLPQVHPTEWLAALAALVVGHGMARWSARKDLGTWAESGEAPAIAPAPHPGR